MTRLRRWGVAAAIGSGCSLLSCFVITLSFSPLAVSGSTAPVELWGPNLGIFATIAAVSAPVVAALVTQGRWRWACLIIWVAILALTTHRLVDRADGTAADRWFGLFSAHNTAITSEDATGLSCRFSWMLSVCTSGAGEKFSTVTLLPFQRMQAIEPTQGFNSNLNR